jgi:hypothetical protein
LRRAWWLGVFSALRGGLRRSSAARVGWRADTIQNAIYVVKSMHGNHCAIHSPEMLRAARSEASAVAPAAVGGRGGYRIAVRRRLAGTWWAAPKAMSGMRETFRATGDFPAGPRPASVCQRGSTRRLNPHQQSISAASRLAACYNLACTQQRGRFRRLGVTSSPSFRAWSPGDNRANSALALLPVTQSHLAGGQGRTNLRTPVPKVRGQSNQALNPLGPGG